MEIWKDIKGFEGLYQVSNLGRVKTLGRKVIVETKMQKRNKLGIKGLSFSKKNNSYIGIGYINNKKVRKWFSINKYGNEEALNLAIGFIEKYKNDNKKVITFKEKILSQVYDNKTRYYNVKLRKDNKTITKTVHRLVIETFIPNVNKKPLTDHVNGIKTDNRVINLRWCTQKENMKYAEKLGLTNFGRKPIVCSNNIRFESSRKAAVWINNNLFNNTKNIESLAKLIRRCTDTKYKAYGFTWKSL